MIKFEKYAAALIVFSALLTMGAAPAAENAPEESDAPWAEMDEAVKEQQQENAKPPTPPSQAEQKAKEERQEHRDKKAEAALAKKPESPRTQEAGSRYFMERGDNERAEALAEKGLALARPDGDPRLTARLLVNRGLVRYVRHDYSGAHQDAKQALKFDPASWSAWELAMYSLNKWPKGKRQPALALKPGESVAGNSSDGQGDGLRPASGAIARAPGEGPHTPRAADSEEDSPEREKISRLLALQTPGLSRTPEEWVQRQKLSPSPTFELITRSMASRQKGSLSEALSLAEAAVKADPSDPMTFAQRALILNQMNDSRGAVLDLSRVIAKGWKWSLAFKMRADALFKAGRWRAAMEDAEIALRLDPQDADAYFIRAMARGKLQGAAELVLADLEKAAALKPALAPFLEQARERFRK